MKKIIFSLMAIIAMLVSAPMISAQNSLPAPGSGGSFSPSGPGFGGGGGGFGGPGFGPGPGWGPGWGAYNPGPPPVYYVNPVIGADQGVTKVIACGYDATGVWRVIPLVVSYSYNGVQYDVYVLNAWNPWTDSWDKGVDVNAYNTDYQLRGNTYDFYAVLSFGTFYFNL